MSEKKDMITASNSTADFITGPDSDSSISHEEEDPLITVLKEISRTLKEMNNTIREIRWSMRG